MNNKNLYIGLGVLAVAGIGFYMWKKKQGESSETETAGVSEEKASATGRFGRVSPRFSPRVTPVVVANAVVTDSTKPYKGSASGKWICPYFDEKDQVWKEAPCKMFTT